MTALTLNHSTFVHLAHLVGKLDCSRLNNESVALPSTSIFVYDTLVILVVSYRLVADAVIGDSWRSRFLSVMTGKGLFSLSRALLKTGQFYYL